MGESAGPAVRAGLRWAGRRARAARRRHREDALLRLPGFVRPAADRRHRLPRRDGARRRRDRRGGRHRPRRQPRDRRGLRRLGRRRGAGRTGRGFARRRRRAVTSPSATRTSASTSGRAARRWRRSGRRCTQALRCGTATVRCRERSRGRDRLAAKAAGHPGAQRRDEAAVRVPPALGDERDRRSARQGVVLRARRRGHRRRPLRPVRGLRRRLSDGLDRDRQGRPAEAREDVHRMLALLGLLPAGRLPLRGDLVDRATRPDDWRITGVDPAPGLGARARHGGGASAPASRVRGRRSPGRRSRLGDPARRRSTPARSTVPSSHGRTPTTPWRGVPTLATSPEQIRERRRELLQPDDGARVPRPRHGRARAADARIASGRHAV